MRFLLILCFTAGSLYSFSQDYSLDKKLGEENSRLVESQIGLYQHDSLQQLINAVGQKLVSRLKSKPFEFRFYLADSEEANAFALPGGYIYVTRGILPLIQTEDELAGVMAHEIIHVMQRHSVKQMKKQAYIGILKVPGNLINAVTGTHLGSIINAPISLATGSFIAKYSRGHEKEADDFGIQLAASAGYKTDALADALERLSKETKVVTGQAERRSYFSDHPYTPKRVSDVRSSAHLYRPVSSSSVTASKEQFLHTFNSLCFGPNPAQGVFIDSLFVHAGLNFSWIVPSKWQKVNKPTIVAAFEEKGQAIVGLRVAGIDKRPKDFGLAMKDTLESKRGIKIESARDTSINSLTAYIIRASTQEKDQVALMEIIWVQMGQQVYQLIAMSAPQFIDEAHKGLCSFRSATNGERDKVQLYTLNVVSANQNETVDEISKRTGNRLIPGLTRLYNDIGSEAKLKEGDLVKIVTAHPYRP